MESSQLKERVRLTLLGGLAYAHQKWVRGDRDVKTLVEWLIGSSTLGGIRDEGDGDADAGDVLLVIGKSSLPNVREFVNAILDEVGINRNTYWREVAAENSPNKNAQEGGAK